MGNSIILCVLILFIKCWWNLFSNSGMWSLKTLQALLIRVGYKGSWSWFLAQIISRFMIIFKHIAEIVAVYCSQNCTKTSGIEPQTYPLLSTNAVVWKEVPYYMRIASAVFHNIIRKARYCNFNMRSRSKHLFVIPSSIIICAKRSTNHRSIPWLKWAGFVLVCSLRLTFVIFCLTKTKFI